MLHWLPRGAKGSNLVQDRPQPSRTAKLHPLGRQGLQRRAGMQLHARPAVLNVKHHVGFTGCPGAPKGAEELPQRLPRGTTRHSEEEGRGGGKSMHGACHAKATTQAASVDADEHAAQTPPPFATARFSLVAGSVPGRTDSHACRSMQAGPPAGR